MNHHRRWCSMNNKNLANCPLAIDWRCVGEATDAVWNPCACRPCNTPQGGIDVCIPVVRGTAVWSKAQNRRRLATGSIPSLPHCVTRGGRPEKVRVHTQRGRPTPRLERVPQWLGTLDSVRTGSDHLFVIHRGSMSPSLYPFQSLSPDFPHSTFALRAALDEKSSRTPVRLGPSGALADQQQPSVQGPLVLADNPLPSVDRPLLSTAHRILPPQAPGCGRHPGNRGV